VLRADTRVVQAGRDRVRLGDLAFLVLQDAVLALRLSKVVMVTMLFVLGWWIGRWSGASARGSGFVLALAGSVLAVACIALGG